MGLDFSHGKAHWAYSGFMRFRERLVRDLGYMDSLLRMYEDGSYTILKDEPIYPLINHSDCDGELTVQEMQQILPQLEDLINAWDDDYYDKGRGLAFIMSMEEAIASNEPLEFM